MVAVGEYVSVMTVEVPESAGMVSTTLVVSTAAEVGVAVPAASAVDNIAPSVADVVVVVTGVEVGVAVDGSATTKCEAVAASAASNSPRRTPARRRHCFSVKTEQSRELMDIATANNAAAEVCPNGPEALRLLKPGAR